MLIEGTLALASLYGTASLVHVVYCLWYKGLKFGAVIWGKSSGFVFMLAFFNHVSVTSHKVLESWTFCKEVHRKFNKPQILQKEKTLKKNILRTICIIWRD